MESMGGLNISLPGSSPMKNQPEQLLQAFKAAALSVTQLYKLAAADNSSAPDLTRARADGYQDAIDDLLQFLDKGNIGLGDGEGWRIRTWATERLDGREAGQNLDSDEEIVLKSERDVSPSITRAQSTNNTVTNTRAASPSRSESVPPPSAMRPEPISAAVPQGNFTFRSQQQFPQDADMTLSDLNLSDSRSSSEPSSIHPPTNLSLSRASRASLRHGHATRHGVRASGLLGRGSGSKRKINFGEFFDIGNLGHGKDGLGLGGKRTRFS